MSSERNCKIIFLIIQANQSVNVLPSFQAISKDLLPGKKVIKNSKFLEQRRTDLEKYLQTIITIVQQLPVIPYELIMFLDFYKYDIVFLLQKMSKDLVKMQGDKVGSFTILEVSFQVHFEYLHQFLSLQLCSISERLRLPQSSAFDFSDILDYCSGLETLLIVPSTLVNCDSKDEYLQHLINPIEKSNILPSTLNFELKPFSSLNELIFKGIVPQNITSCNPARSTVVKFTVNFTRVQNIQQILLPEMIHDTSIAQIDPKSLGEHAWLKVKEVNFGYNDIWIIDSAMHLVPNVQEIHLNDNRLRTVANLSSLHHLNCLNLSGNLIDSLKDWYLQLGNIEVLNLSRNRLKSLVGLSRLRSLRTVDLSQNDIDDFQEIDEIAQLPVIEQLGLNGNPLILECDFRVKVLTRFNDRCTDIILDNERSSQNEIDKAMVLAALRKSKLITNK